MTQYCYVILNNAGHSWLALSHDDVGAARDQAAPVLNQLLQDGWMPIRETPMGGGTSSLAHSLILLEKGFQPKSHRPRKPK